MGQIPAISHYECRRLMLNGAGSFGVLQEIRGWKMIAGIDMLLQTLYNERQQILSSIHDKEVASTDEMNRLYRDLDVNKDIIQQIKGRYYVNYS